MTAGPPLSQKESRPPRAVLALIIGLSVFGLLIVGGVVGALVWLKSERGRDIGYEVGGTARSVVIVYGEEPEPGQQRLEGVAPPWTKTFHTDFMVARAFVVVTRPVTSTGTVSCTLRVNGQIVATDTSTADGPPIARCQEPE